MVEKHLGRICAIIVSYNIGRRFEKTFTSILPQVNKVFIVDNGSDQETISLVKRLQQEHPKKTKIVFNRENLGVARAQNIGLEYAMDEHFDWALLLDHDSQAHLDMIENMSRALKHHPEREAIGLIAAHVKDAAVEVEPLYTVPKHKIFFQRRSVGENQYMDGVLCVIASGSLIRTDVIRVLGKFREDFFIDYVDSEFCLRLITNGWKILLVRDAVLEHTLGEKQEHKFLGVSVITTNHSPERRYTIYRNRAYLWKKYLLRIPGYVLFDMTAAGYDLLRILLFEKNSMEKLTQAITGGITGLLKSNWLTERS